MRKTLKIGDMSKLCNISIKTLRYYEEMGLIKPVEVDIYSGYRYYDENNVEDIYKIQFLKDLDLSLKEIKDFNDKSLVKRMKDINKEIKRLRKQKQLINSLINLKGEKIMKPFINDEQAIGKWKYIATAISKEHYLAGDTTQYNNILIKQLFFLPNGEGYWIFDKWTKGEIYHFRGVVYKYEIEDGKLFLYIYNCDNEFEIVGIYEKEDNLEHTKEDAIVGKDNTNMPFVSDEDAIGSWSVVDWIGIEEKYTYIPKDDVDMSDMFLANLSLLSNGDCFLEKADKEIIKMNWTKEFILNHNRNLASNYIIKHIDNELYLIMDWKSGDYVYGGGLFFLLIK